MESLRVESLYFQNIMMYMMQELIKLKPKSGYNDNKLIPKNNPRTTPYILTYVPHGPSMFQSCHMPIPPPVNWNLPLKNGHDKR